VTDQTAEAIRERNRAGFDGAIGRAYSWYMDRPRMARVIGAIVWGADTRPFYRRLGAVREVPDGAVVVDAPCGSGIALKGLDPAQNVRYLALDLSGAMLERARRRAAALGLSQVEFVQGDVEQIPAGNRSVDLFLSWWGLHCVPDPGAAVREAARCLKPGGRLVGGMICKGDGLRQRLIVRPGTGLFGPTGTPDDLAAWMERAGLTREGLEVSGPFAYFEASA
jgi:SAM-dependent methyltransferase